MYVDLEGKFIQFNFILLKERKGYYKMNLNLNNFYLASLDDIKTIFVWTGNWIIWTLFMVSLKENIEF